MNKSCQIYKRVTSQPSVKRELLPICIQTSDLTTECETRVVTHLQDGDRLAAKENRNSDV